MTAGPMETLDRRISASTDQLDTLRKKKGTEDFEDSEGAHRSRRTGSNSSTRHPRPRSATRFALGNEKKNDNNRSSYVMESEENEFTLNCRGDKISRNSYFFSSSRKCDNKPATSTTVAEPVMRKSNLKNGSGRQKKTAVDIFLEDEGPYSRKLYGPPPISSSDEKTSNSDEAWRKKKTKSHEILNEGC